MRRRLTPWIFARITSEQLRLMRGRGVPLRMALWVSLRLTWAALRPAWWPR